MAVKIGSARMDENGKITGGRAGDQTGKEVSTQDWYKHSKGWRVLRAKNVNVAEHIAVSMERACANVNIGYDQGQRSTLFAAAEKVGFDCAKVAAPCETDCSALVRVCVHYAGIRVGDFTTGNQAAALLATGQFDEMTESKYTGGSEYLSRGDILVTKTKGHTVVVLTDGAKGKREGALPEPPVDSVRRVQITGGTVNIRKGPGTEYGIVRVARAGETYAVPDTEDWTPVMLNGAVCWVSGAYCKEAT